MENKKIEIRPYTLKELASFYKVDPRTFRKWIKPFEDELGNKIGYLYSIPQVKLIFHKLSFPSAFIIHNDEE